MTHLGVREGLLEEGGQPGEQNEEGASRAQLGADSRPVWGNRLRALTSCQPLLTLTPCMTHFFPKDTKALPSETGGIC